MSVVCSGYQVVEPDASGRVRPLSRVFPVKEAALRFAELARAAGHQGATVESILVLENPKGLNHELDL